MCHEILELFFHDSNPSLLRTRFWSESFKFWLRDVHHTGESNFRLFSHDTFYVFTHTRILFDCPTIGANKRPGKVFDSDSGQFKKSWGKQLKLNYFFFIFNTSITLEKILKLFSNLNFQGFWTNINLFEFPYRANRPTLKDNSGQPLYV